VKRRPGTPDPTLDRADGPTLAMSTVHLDTARLRQLLVFERTLRAAAPAGCPSSQVALAHAEALTASGLAAADVEAPLALLRRFAANRALAARLGGYLVQLTARASTDAAAADQASEVRQRLAGLDQALQLREATATRSVLEAHAEEILCLFAASPLGEGTS
jgi:hypothetical protein